MLNGRFGVEEREKIPATADRKRPAVVEALVEGLPDDFRQIGGFASCVIDQILAFRDSLGACNSDR